MNLYPSIHISAAEGPNSQRSADFSPLRLDSSGGMRMGEALVTLKRPQVRAPIAWKFAPREAAFTMVEIAIALGVIAFALIAIIGILPVGLQTSRDNREETIINQDARLLVEAIKSGGRDLSSDLGAYVVRIDDDGTDYSMRQPPGILTSNLISLLTDTNSHTNVFSAISGAVVNRGNEFGLRYQVVNEVRRVPEFDGTPLSNQVFEVRLRFAWPVSPAGKVGSEANRYVVRTLVSGIYNTDSGFFYAQQYSNAWSTTATNFP